MDIVTISKGSILFNYNNNGISTKLIINKDIKLNITYNEKDNNYNIYNEELNICIYSSTKKNLKHLIIENLIAAYITYTYDKKLNNPKAQKLSDKLKEHIIIIKEEI